MSIQSQFQALKDNPRTTLKLIPLWSIPNALYSTYTVLYAAHMGVTATDLGIISSVSFGIRFIASFFAGTTSNRLGRKRTVVFFDILSWIVPLGIWAVSSNFWYFLVAAAFNSLGSIGGVANSCILIEETELQQKLFVFRINETLNAASGLFVPLAGLLIGILGFIPALRVLYVFGFFAMITMDVLKAILLRDNRYGQTARQSVLFRGVARDSMKSLRYFAKKPALNVLIMQSFLFSFAQAITDVYYFLYLTKNLSISESAVSVIPFLNAIVALVFLNLFMPRLARMTGSNWPGITLHLLGTAVLIASSLKPSLALILLNSLLWAAGKACLNPVLNSRIAAEIDEDVRANILSFVNMISMVFLLPAGIIGAFLYKANPILPFCLVMLIYVSALVLQPLLNHKKDAMYY